MPVFSFLFFTLFSSHNANQEHKDGLINSNMCITNLVTLAIQCVQFVPKTTNWIIKIISQRVPTTSRHVDLIFILFRQILSRGQMPVLESQHHSPWTVLVLKVIYYQYQNCILDCITNYCTNGNFTHEPRTVTMKLWEPPKKCPKADLRHLQNHVVWPQILKFSIYMKPYVTGPSTKCYFNEFLFMRALTHDKIE